jgi:hypothetical protein
MRARVHTANDDRLGELRTLDGPASQARVSHAANDYDGAGRRVAAANYAR